MTTLVAFTRFQRRPSGRGFALVATLSIIALITILAMGLLSLSQNSLRRNTQDKARAEAQANARLSLSLAIGALQKSMGPDQRISANADILSDPASPTSTVAGRQWTGVWNSWKAGVGEPSQHSTIGQTGEMAPGYQANRRDYFQGWLLSLNPSEARAVDTPKTLNLVGDLLPSANGSAVKLVGQGSLDASAPATDQVSARLLVSPAREGGKRSRHAYWVGDESQKARIMSDSYALLTNPTLAQRFARTQAPGSTGTKTISDLENITADQEKQIQSVPNLNALDTLVKTEGKYPSRKNFHAVTPYSRGVLADVREGGLKRDLQTILERRIDPNEVYNLETPSGLEADFKRATSIIAATSTTPGGNDFMLYRFDDMVNSSSPTGEASVPIQDLAAYYQLYDHFRTGWKGGIQFRSQDSSPANNLLRNGIMVSNPDYGVNSSDYDKYLRQHSALYRSVYPVKIEFVLSYLTEPRPQADIDADKAGNPSANPPVPPNPNPDTHRLKVGITPAMTWWNPNNVPVVMNFGNPDLASIMIRENAVPLRIDLRKHNSLGGTVTTNTVVDMTRLTNTQQGELYTLFISGNSPVVFQPGESKVLALKFSSQSDPNAGSASLDFYLRGTGYRFSEPFVPSLELVPGWNPERFIRPTGRQGVATTGYLNFKATDYISANINTGSQRNFAVDFTQKSRHGRNAAGVMWHYRGYGLRMRMFPGGYPNYTVYTPFLTAFNAAGLNPTGSSIANTAMGTGIDIAGRSGQNLINAMQDPANLLDDIPQSFFYYGMKAATETHESANTFPSSGAGASRRFPARPFTHSTVMMPQFIDTVAGPNLYNIGWNWFYMPMNNILDAPISISRDSHGYYGGGYTAENGTTHVVQQELPVAPPISIAALSHAQLSGYSLSSEAAAAGYAGLQNLNGTEAFRRTTAIGFGGLEPRTLQAIGNSYAHPYIPKNRAITTFNRVYYQNTATATPVAEPFADHSYLANKALWDEYFFSSITPVPAGNPVFNTTARTVADVTKGFFGAQREHLPNRRLIPYKQNLSDTKLTTLLGEYSTYKNGFADKIASYMMVEGPFNVNSTSEAAWKTLFSSLRGKPVSHLDPKDAVGGSIKVTETTSAGVPVGTGPLPNAKPRTASSSDPSDLDQWLGWRELTDKEIDELAKAMVKQVKKRGPFLSLSEFVNRRLDNTNTELSLMGALQAAIDDPGCSINEGFRNSVRRFSARERSFAAAVFPEALDGPVAYGSSAYVDQADILRNLAEQLTPRGDTFIVRAYADTVDGSDKVAARVWCEAIVQRLPDYCEPSNDPHLKAADPALTSINKFFGRRMQIVSFRWLDASEI